MSQIENDVEYSIIVNDLKKKFKVYYDKGSELKEKLLFRKRSYYEERWVLKGISFNIKKGEAVGLIGHNGCGKSTTLKLLSKIMYPDSGSIICSGRISSLIELGAGFHPDMSGRENIFTNASIFGLGRKEIDSRLEDIIAFSELEEFIDNPVRTYSSGMYMRLAFSVAINVDADILLIDEILAVGDVNFQAKCFNKLREIKEHGTTIVIVSHSMGQIEQICDRTIWLHEGLIRGDGRPREIHPEYIGYMGQKREQVAEKEKARRAKSDVTVEETASIEENVENNINISEKKEDQKSPIKRWGNGKARIIQIKLLDNVKKEKNVIATGDNIEIVVDYKIHEKVDDAVFGIGIFRNDGKQCYGTNTRIDHIEQFDLKNSGQFKVCLTNVNLLPGSYSIDIAIESESGIPVDYYKEALKFDVYSEIEDVGVCRINHKWVIT